MTSMDSNTIKLAAGQGMGTMHEQAHNAEVTI